MSYTLCATQSTAQQRSQVKRKKQERLGSAWDVHISTLWWGGKQGTRPASPGRSWLAYFSSVPEIFLLLPKRQICALTERFRLYSPHPFHTNICTCWKQVFWCIKCNYLLPQQCCKIWECMLLFQGRVTPSMAIRNLFMELQCSCPSCSWSLLWPW